ncbi:MAG: LamG-like jellyroll fold domain-containing protein [Patescibacteria group bacterium]|jgi:hypothetical protein
MKKIKYIFGLIVFSLLLFVPALCRAMPPGTLLYRTSGAGKMYGYSADPLIYTEKGILKDIYAGHVGMYIGSENGEDYIVEAMSNGIVKTPAKYFVNSSAGEVFLGAKIPSAANDLQTAKVVALAKSLVGKNLGYDLDFKYQKGPKDGQWTCVGLAEKLYESANISNPNNLAALEYDSNYYAVDITPDGFDNYSVVNDAGDCFSAEREYSKIARKKNLLIPAPELIGFNVGLEYNGERYIFLPYTQFLQKTLQSVAVDITVASEFTGENIRAALNTNILALRWSLINNPLSTLKNLAQSAATFITQTAVKTGELAKSLGTKIFGENSLAEITLDPGAISGPNSTSTKKTVKTAATSTKKTTAVKSPANSAAPASWPAVKVNKATGNFATTKVVTPTKTTGQTSSSTKKTSVVSSTVKNIAETASKTPSAKSASSSIVKTGVNTTYYAPAVASSAASSRGSGGGGGSSSNSAIVANNWSKLAKINRIYATGNNDFVELINTTDHDFDLAAAGYRLERAKTADDPSLIMRLGDLDDGLYPGGTIIKAHGNYLIARADANPYYKNQAAAIALRDEFSWTGSGYTLYLGVGAISSSVDPDIIDAVGFGSDATFFQGSRPAPDINDNYILRRAASTGDNFVDFNLVLTDDPEVLAAMSAAQLATTTEEISTSTNDVATTTEEISTSTNDVATTTEEISTSTNDVATTTEDVASSSENVASSTSGTASTTEAVTPAPLALINKIYSTGDNDWLELFNPTDNDFDLAAAFYRLEKTKTAVTPSLLMRLGNPADGLYPGGTIIKARDNYLIVRDDANAYYKNQADAIALRDDFTWDNSGYTFYLGTGAISSSTDVNIRDLVGFGTDAIYWQGGGPAPAIPDNYILNRLSATNNNASDFNLILSDDPSIIFNPQPDANLNLFVQPVPILSSGLTNVWHFNECYGSGRWAVGKWDCAQEVGYTYDKFSRPLDTPASLNSFSASFYYKKSSQFPRLDLHLTNSGTDHLLMILDPGMITIEGLPNSQWRYYKTEMMFDDNWHQATLVVNQIADYWAVYIDGREIIRESFFADLASFSGVEMYDDNGSALFDELVIWNRPLASTEVLANYLTDAPYSPLIIREPQSAPELLHSWKFEEDAGSLAVDSFSSSTLSVNPASWVGRSHDNYALRISQGNSYSLDFNEPIISQDLSLAFWWRNSAYPSMGRININLNGGLDGGSKILALLADYYRLGYWFNNQYGILSEGVNEAVPYDDAWHHLALVYDSYRYKLNFYVDGEVKASSSLVRLKDGEAVKRLEISSDNFNTELDDLNIYSGALSVAQIRQIYLDTK